MRLILLIISFFFVTQNAENVIINTDYDFFKTNELGNIYIVKKNILSFYDSEGNFKFKYSNFKHGDIHYIDVTDPMRILIFYKDFNQILFLDNTLSEISDFLNLDEVDVVETNAVCSSNTGGFWLYNDNKAKLQKYNINLELVQEGTSMEQLISRDFSPDFLDEQGNNIYMGIKNKGVYVFDIFGTYKKFIPVKYKNSIQIFNENIYYFNDSIYKYNMKDFETDVLKIPEIDYNSFSISQEKLYIGDNHKIIELK